MSFNYSNQSNNQYMNYAQRNKIPQSVLQSNNTPHKQTLIRNQSFQNRVYNEDLIQLIAKIRALEDDLINQRFKNESLQRKIIEYEKIIDNLEYQLTSQSYQLQKYLHQIELSNQKNLQILKYQQNLKLVGQEIQELNNVLVSKNKDYELILQRNKNMNFQIKRCEEQNHLLRVNQSIFKKQLDSIIQEIHSQYQNVKQTNHNQANQSLNESPPRNFSSSPSPKKPSLYNVSSLTQKDDSFNYQNNKTKNQDINKRFQILRTLFNDFLHQYLNMGKEAEQQKKQISQKYAKQKQKAIKYEYEYKLLDQRLKDQSKKQDLITSYYNQKKIEQMIEELLKKQDQYVLRLQQLNHQNNSLKEQIEQLESGNSYIQKIDLQEKSSMIQSLKKENDLLQSTIEQLTKKMNSLQNQYDSFVEISEKQNHREVQNNLFMGKKLRKIEEQNYQLKIKMQELMGEINVLNKQIMILKDEQQQEVQNSPSSKKSR